MIDGVVLSPVWLAGLTLETIDITFESLSHSRFDCKYHLVFVPKYRSPVFHELAQQKGCRILEGHMVQDHVHMLISIPPKYAVSQIVGYTKGKRAVAVARQFNERKQNFNGEQFWARGYAVSTVGFEEEQIIKYIRNQEQLDSKGFDEKGDF